ncbi:class I SAM-dependent methyltransferase [Actinoplanes sp. NPDC051851]|uniref:class I SAM-dependent methyltransferase n=1 Tax=Actinoplanes sp. NPDC051851 TaxID=3154753 RepID=UPI00343F408B
MNNTLAEREDTSRIAATWFGAVPGLTDRLEAGARVADVGCWHGFAGILVARAWPACDVLGFDRHEPSIATARARAAEAGDPPNVAFHQAGFEEIGGYGPFDVVLFVDSLHDLGDPGAAVRAAYRALTPGGVLVAVEPKRVCPERRLALLTEAGFTGASVAADSGFTAVLTATR